MTRAREWVPAASLVLMTAATPMAAAFAQQSPWDPAHELDPESLYGSGGSLPPAAEVIAIGVGVLFWGAVLYFVGRGVYRYWRPSHMRSESTAQKAWLFIQILFLIGGFVAAVVLLHAI